MKIKRMVTYLILAILLLAMPEVYAAESLSEMKYDQASFNEIYEQGTANTTAGQKSTVPNDSLVNAVTSIIVRGINPIPNAISLIMTITSTGNVYPAFSIQDLVFGEMGIFNVNFFNPDSNSVINTELSNQISMWFYALRNVTAVLNLGILIYVAIRMAISTVAEEKARYKKMLIDWVVGFAIIMVLPYIMAIIMNLADAILDILKNILSGTKLAGAQKIEDQILGNMIYTQASGFSILIPSITFWILVFFQMKFFLMYLRRIFATAFLMIISPLISATYAIDKIGDGKSQAWSSWIKEFSINVFIQPLHAFLYLLFMVTAYNLVEKAPLLAVVFLMGLSRGERIIRNVFRIQNLESVKSMQDNLKFGKKK